MLDTKRIKSLLRETRRQVFELQKDFQPLSQKELLANENLYYAAEHRLQLAIQSCIDIANHIVAALALPAPSKETSDLFIALTKEDIIPEEFALVMKDVVAYRNVLVHGYMDVERRITYDNIQKHLSDLSGFAKYIEQFLGKQVKN